MTQTRDSLKDKTILVTGGAGFIGSHLVDALLARGAKSVVIVDNMFLGRQENIDDALATGRAHFYKDDVEFASSLDFIFSAHAIDVVFHCATKALNYSFQNPSNAFSTNVTTTLNLLELQRRKAFKTLCHFSTSEVYGTAVYEPMDEQHPLNPTTTYAAGKAAADMAVQSYQRMFGLDAFIVRPFNNYGPRQNHSGPLAGVIPITAYRVLNNIAPEIHGDGLQTRDFIYVTDTVDAILKLYPIMAAGDSVNISTDHQLSIADVITRVAAYFDYKGQIIRKPERPSDVRCHHASNAKIKSMIDYQLTPFDQGLLQTLTFYKTRLKG